MLNKDEETKQSKLPAHVCKQDAAAQNRMFRPLYTLQERLLADELNNLVANAHSNTIYLNFRESKFVVKVEQYAACKEDYSELKMLTAFLAEHSEVTVKRNATHKFFTVKKAA